MDILEIARQSGMLVLLDAQIGKQTYHSVQGSLPALQCFATAVCAAAMLAQATPSARECMADRHDTIR